VGSIDLSAADKDGESDDTNDDIASEAAMRTPPAKKRTRT
jgi:hypothetical protein